MTDQTPVDMLGNLVRVGDMVAFPIYRTDFSLCLGVVEEINGDGYYTNDVGITVRYAYKDHSCGVDGVILTPSIVIHCKGVVVLNVDTYIDNKTDVVQSLLAKQFLLLVSTKDDNNAH